MLHCPLFHCVASCRDITAILNKNLTVHIFKCVYVSDKIVCLWSHSNTELLSQNDSEQKIMGK